MNNCQPSILPLIYPENSWPLLVNNAIHSVQLQTQSPLPYIATIAMSVIAETVQGLAYVQIPSGPICSLSVSVLAILDSGGGKSPVLKMLRKPVVDFEAEMQEIYKEKMQVYRTSEKIWKITDDEYAKALRRAITKGEDVVTVEERIVAHQKVKPEKPPYPVLTYANPTIEALVHGLAKNWPNAAVVSDEASGLINGRLAQGLALLNQLMDGARVSVERKGEPDPIIVPEPRLTCVLALQPGQLEKYFNRTGEDARDIGFLARTLICKPFVMPGSRNVSPVEPDPQFLDQFHDRVKALLKQSVGQDGLPITKKRAVVFCPEAAEAYVNLRQQIETGLMVGGYFANIKDFAEKAARHVAKLAAMLEIFVNDSYVIRTDMLWCAMSLINWHAEEFKRIFAKPDELAQPFQDANTLLPWLHHFMRGRTNRYLMKNDVLKHAPSSLRSKARLESALQVLVNQGQLGWNVLLQGKMHFLDLFPALPFDMYALQIAVEHYRFKKKSFVR